jgi:two-component system, OmpR family, heavy metal sensor histidine kinase CusS
MSSAELNALEAGRQAKTPGRRSLSSRLSRLYFGMSLCLLLLATCVLYWGIKFTLDTTDYQVLEKRLLTLRDVIKDPGTDEGVVGHELSEDLEGPRRIYMRILSDVAELQLETPETPSALEASRFPSVDAIALDAIRQGTIESASGKYFRVVSSRMVLPPRWNSAFATLQVAVDTSRDEEVLAWLRFILALVVCAAAAVCWLIARYLVGRELRPLRQIAAAASKIRSETLSYRLELNDLPSELCDLAEQFNQMLTRLEATYARLRHYADEVAHELRSPVNKMLIGTEVALGRVRTNEGYREALESNLDECQSLAHIVDRLLFLARAENVNVVLDLRQVCLASELEIIREFFAASADEAACNLSMSCDPEIVVDIDRILFRRAISNLVANAISHTPSGGSISIAGKSEKEYVTVTVSDTGEGIPADEHEKVFDRFYMVETARSPGGKRVGLGLAITKSIVVLHGGSIALQSFKDEGTRVTVTLVKPADPMAVAHPAAPSNASAGMQTPSDVL